MPVICGWGGQASVPSGVPLVHEPGIPVRAYRGLVRTGGALDPEKRVSIPVRAGDCLGDRGERLIGPAIQGEPFVENHHGVGRVLPLADELRSGFDLDPAENAGTVAIAN